IDPHGLCHDQGIRSHAIPAQRTGSLLVPAARHKGRGAPCGESFWHWALGADVGHGHAQPPFRSSRLIGAERQPTSDCRQSLQQSLISRTLHKKSRIFDGLCDEPSRTRHLPASTTMLGNSFCEKTILFFALKLTSRQHLSSDSRLRINGSAANLKHRIMSSTTKAHPTEI